MQHNYFEQFQRPQPPQAPQAPYPGAQGPPQPRIPGPVVAGPQPGMAPEQPPQAGGDPFAGLSPMAKMLGAMALGKGDIGGAMRAFKPQKPIERRISKDVAGYARYPDTGERVYPGVEKPLRTGRAPYKETGPYVGPEGGYIGEGVFDKYKGTWQLRTADGLIDMPSEARPRTETGLLRGAMSGKDFYVLAGDAEDNERSLRNLTRYMKNVATTEQGWGLLADQFLGHINTIFGGELTPEQFRTLVQNGQLQGLLGGFRKEVVGGGVMTEQDALRIISRLGGDTNILRNKEVAAQLIKELMFEKTSNYNNVILPMYNNQLKQIPRGAFPVKKRIDVEGFFKTKKIPPPPSGFRID